MTIISRLGGVAAATALARGIGGPPSNRCGDRELAFRGTRTPSRSDVRGVNAEGLFVEDVHVLMKTTGPAGLVYFAVNVRGTTTYTNL